MDTMDVPGRAGVLALAAPVDVDVEVASLVDPLTTKIGRESLETVLYPGGNTYLKEDWRSLS